MDVIAEKCLYKNWEHIADDASLNYFTMKFVGNPKTTVIYVHFINVIKHEWYAKLFVKMLYEFGFIEYMQYRDIFESCPFHKNYMDLFVHYDGNNPVKQGLCKYYNYINTEHWDVDDGCEIEVCERYPIVFHIYLCCIPEYINYCIAEIATLRAPLATIFTICCTETTDISLPITVFADEFLVATITGFL